MEKIASNEFRNTSTGNDGSELIKILNNYIPKSSSVLLIGMGSGRDFQNLSNYYNVTGSDFSKLLLSVYQKVHPEADLITLDPIELETKRFFDAVYSNKVLHQMSENELIQSLSKQSQILNPGGYALHSFWSGNKEEDHHGLKWIYYTEEAISDLIPSEFEIVELKTYKERIDHDSLYIVLRKKS